MSSSAAQIFPSLQGDQVPARSRPFLENVKKGFGSIPNLFAAFSNSPTLLEGYLGLDATYSRATLSAAERQLELLTPSVVNECGYCTAAHSTVAKGIPHSKRRRNFASSDGGCLTQLQLIPGALV